MAEAYVREADRLKGLAGQRYSNVTLGREERAGMMRRRVTGLHDTFRKHPGAFHLPRYRRRNKREILPKPAYGRH